MQNSWIRKINGSEKKGNFKYREPSFNPAVKLLFSTTELFF